VKRATDNGDMTYKMKAAERVKEKALLDSIDAYHSQKEAADDRREAFDMSTRKKNSNVRRFSSRLHVGYTLHQYRINQVSNAGGGRSGWWLRGGGFGESS
jgi:hypothetical protein